MPGRLDAERRHKGDSKMTINKICAARTTRCGPSPCASARTPEEARQAALSSVSVTCLDYNTTFPGDHTTMPDHRCRDSRGRDNTEMKLARATGARREALALKTTRPTLCQLLRPHASRSGPHVLVHPRSPPARGRGCQVAAARWPCGTRTGARRGPERCAMTTSTDIVWRILTGRRARPRCSPRRHESLRQALGRPRDRTLRRRQGRAGHGHHLRGSRPFKPSTPL